MSIDATDVRDLINNPEGRTPYPEDNKVMLGATPGGGETTPAKEYELYNESIDRGTATATKLIIKGNDPDDVWEGNPLFIRQVFSSTDIDGWLDATVPVPVSYYISTNMLPQVPEFDAISASNFLKSADYGYQSGAWQVEWAKTRTPLMSWSSDNHANTLNKGNYDEHNSVMLVAELGASADASTHKLNATYFFTNLFNEFLNNVVKASLTDADTTIKFSVIDLGGNLMSFNDSIKDAVTRQIVIVNNHESSYSSYITQTLGTKLSGALGRYGIHIEWDKKIIEDDEHTYDKLGVIE